MPIKSFNGISPDIHPSVFIADPAFINGDVVIGANSSVWAMVTIRGDVNKIYIGKNTNIQDGSVLHCTHKSDYFKGNGLFIGNEVTVGHNATLHACTIHNHCLIGMGSVLLDNCIIEENTIIGAGALVPPNKILTTGLWIGNPVKRIRDLTKMEQEFLSYSALSYVKLAEKSKI